ncbi:dihydroorotate dehydrogenase electron transfer subunit [Paraliobacillus ryukyuensis]|uniref:dihydroorotate dehydrogenase electron transfer subunit n=1 Tax=Paraliobacillus ryukyuensis TaxID=200904 RepID=UPI0009A8CE78|nr:dihydroorotate dehydrogenase electron transfer subunit [Paraliobacillus ryukyuensis]
MIRKDMLSIKKLETIAKDTFLIVLASNISVDDVAPGQFIHIRIGQGNAHLLRRPISIADVDQANQLLTIIFKSVGEGTTQLSKQKVGDQVDTLLPCGTAYPIAGLTMHSALLIGGGIGVPPLYYLAKQLVAKGIKVTAILGFQNKEHVFYEQEFQALGDVYIATNDGSYGYQGFVTDVYQQVQPDFDYYFSCGPTAMLKSVTSTLEDKQGYISLEERMGCGVGACFACVVPSHDGGYRKICQQGPVFPAKEVVLS